MSPDHGASGDLALLAAIAPAAESVPALSVVLVTIRGAISAQRIDGPVVAGRDESCDLVIPDRGASRRHARFAPRGTGIEIIDLDSRNGTFVDGRPARRAIAYAGSAIRVGGALLLVVQLDQMWEPPEIAGPLIGGTAVAPLRRAIELVGPTNRSIFVQGDTGTGKELVARLVHAASGRTGPFVAVDCAALPEHRVESELFGHVRPTFTRTDAGTLFLDELDALPLPAQAKLVRMLEDGSVRVADSATRLDVRFISATSAKLQDAVDRGRFRADLFARLSTVELHLPPLRHRREDIPSLISYLATRANASSLELTGDALEALVLHAWPQNIRELDAVVHALTLRDAAIDLDDLPRHLQAKFREARHSVSPASEPALVADARTRLVEALRAHEGNVRRTATALAMGRGHMYRLIKRFGIDLASCRVPHGTGVDAEGSPRP